MVELGCHHSRPFLQPLTLSTRPNCSFRRVEEDAAESGTPKWPQLPETASQGQKRPFSRVKCHFPYSGRQEGSRGGKPPLPLHHPHHPRYPHCSEVPQRQEREPNEQLLTPSFCTLHNRAEPNGLEKETRSGPKRYQGPRKQIQKYEEQK